MKFKFCCAFFLAAISFQHYLTAQSTSVFDANYFNQDGTEPPLKIGKGFDISDVYKQTRSCFTSESCDQSKLSRNQNGKTTSIKIFYTNTEEQYNELKSNGISGKASFLNLFTIAGSKLDSYSSSSNQKTERLIFIANVDFGVFSYGQDPVLLPDPKGLIAKKDTNDFVKLYGTHYISGVRKESSVWFILTKKNDQFSSTKNNSNQFGVSTFIPEDFTGGLSITGNSQTENFVDANSFDVTIEMNGPSLNKADLQQQIQNILNGNSKDKLTAINNLIGDALSNISDPSQSVITQYYFSPFELYGLKGIYWNTAKQNNLISINESVINTYKIKAHLDNLVAPGGLQNELNQFDLFIPDFSSKETYKKRLATTYNSILPDLKQYLSEAVDTLKFLEFKYKTCSDIYCSSDNSCCSHEEFISDIVKFDFDANSKLGELDSIFNSAFNAFVKEKEASMPECERENKGFVTVKNKSTNPYEFYEGDNYICTLAGGSTTKLSISIGSHNYRAVQESGYLMYATVNNRNVTINNKCDEVTINVGFED